MKRRGITYRAITCLTVSQFMLLSCTPSVPNTTPANSGPKQVPLLLSPNGFHTLVTTPAPLPIPDCEDPTEANIVKTNDKVGISFYRTSTNKYGYFGPPLDSSGNIIWSDFVRGELVLRRETDTTKPDYGQIKVTSLTFNTNDGPNWYVLTGNGLTTGTDSYAKDFTLKIPNDSVFFVYSNEYASDIYVGGNMTLTYSANDKKVKVEVGSTGLLVPNGYSYSGEADFKGAANFDLVLAPEKFDLKVEGTADIDLGKTASLIVTGDTCITPWQLNIEGQAVEPDLQGSTKCAWNRGGSGDEMFPWDGKCDDGRWMQPGNYTAKLTTIPPSPLPGKQAKQVLTDSEQVSVAQNGTVPTPTPSPTQCLPTDPGCPLQCPPGQACPPPVGTPTPPGPSVTPPAPSVTPPGPTPQPCLSGQVCTPTPNPNRTPKPPVPTRPPIPKPKKGGGGSGQTCDPNDKVILSVDVGLNLPTLDQAALEDFAQFNHLLNKLANLQENIIDEADFSAESLKLTREERIKLKIAQVNDNLNETYWNINDDLYYAEQLNQKLVQLLQSEGQSLPPLGVGDVTNLITSYSQAFDQANNDLDLLNELKILYSENQLFQQAIRQFISERHPNQSTLQNLRILHTQLRSHGNYISNHYALIDPGDSEITADVDHQLDFAIQVNDSLIAQLQGDFTIQDTRTDQLKRQLSVLSSLMRAAQPLKGAAKAAKLAEAAKEIETIQGLAATGVVLEVPAVVAGLAIVGAVLVASELTLEVCHGLYTSYNVNNYLNGMEQTLEQVQPVLNKLFTKECVINGKAEKLLKIATDLTGAIQKLNRDLRAVVQAVQDDDRSKFNDLAVVFSSGINFLKTVKIPEAKTEVEKECNPKCLPGEDDIGATSFGYELCTIDHSIGRVKQRGIRVVSVVESAVSSNLVFDQLADGRDVFAILSAPKTWDVVIGEARASSVLIITLFTENNKNFCKKTRGDAFRAPWEIFDFNPYTHAPQFDPFDDITSRECEQLL